MNKNSIQEEYELIFNNVSDAIFLIDVVDDKFVFLRLNKTHEELTGLTTEFVRGKTPEDFLPPEMANGITNNYKQCLNSKNDYIYEEELALPGGTRIWKTRLEPVIINNEVDKIIGIATDITESKKFERELEKLAYFDEMTGAMNRRSGLFVLQNEINHLSEMNDFLSVIFIDIDGLKIINDELGHEAGDNIIKETVRLIKSGIRKGDQIIRMGGDEFLIFLPSSRCNQAESIIQRIYDKTLLQKNNPKIDFSWGVEEIKCNKHLSIKKIIENADKKMYEMKKNKKNHR